MKVLRGVGLSLLVALVLYVTIVSGIDAQAVVGAAARLGWQWWGVLLALSLVNYGLRFLRWHYYLRFLGHTLPLGRNLMIYVAGFAMTATPGKAGEAIRSVYLHRLGVGYGHGLAAVFTERFSDLMVMVLLSTLGLLTFGRYAGGVVAALAAVGVTLAIIQRPELVAYLRRKEDPRHGRWRSAVARNLIAPLSASSSLLRSRPLYVGLLLGVIGWGAEGVSLFYAARVLDIDVSLNLAIGIYAIGMLVGALSFLPGGLGSTEAVMGIMLTLAGASPAVAVACTLITRVATLWFAVLLGVVAFASLSFVQPQPQEQ